MYSKKDTLTNTTSSDPTRVKIKKTIRGRKDTCVTLFIRPAIFPALSRPKQTHREHNQEDQKKRKKLSKVVTIVNVVPLALFPPQP